MGAHGYGMIDVAPLERTELQSRLDNAIVLMIRAHIGKPCPTRRTIMEWTGIPRRHIWRVLREVRARGVIEIDVYDQEPPPPGCNEPKRRRMKVVGDDAGTDWTARRPVSVVRSA
jgi:hypothetical protein